MDSENDYSNNFKFRSVMSEEVSGSDSNTVEVTEKENLWQSYGRWILLGAGAVVLLVGGGILIFAGGGKKKKTASSRKMTRQRKRQKKRQKKQRQSRTRIPNESCNDNDLRDAGGSAAECSGDAAGIGGNGGGAARFQKPMTAAFP